MSALYRVIFVTILIFVLLVAFIAALDSAVSLKEENLRMSRNMESLVMENQVWESKSGYQVTTIKELELTGEELARMRLVDQKMIKGLGLEVKRLKSITNTSTGTHINISPDVKDTTIIRDTIIFTCKSIKFKDAYVTVSGVVCDSIPSVLDIVHTDTIETYAHIIPKKFLFIKYGIKEIRQEVVCRSPYSKIAYSNQIKIKSYGKDN